VWPEAASLDTLGLQTLNPFLPVWREGEISTLKSHTRPDDIAISSFVLTAEAHELRTRRRALSSAGERSLHTGEVAGSIPAAPTTERPIKYGPFGCLVEKATIPKITEQRANMRL
jgi:hypothetical protein